MTPSLPSSVCTLADLFAYRCRERSNQLAYAFVRDSLELEHELTYGELEHRVRVLSGYLIRRAEPGTRVLLLYPPGLDVVCAFWACMCAGLVPVPAPAPDPIRLKHSLPRLRAIIEDAQVSLSLTTSNIGSLSSELSIAKDGGQIDWISTDLQYDLADAVELPKHKETDLAYLQYTSGSTATPRGVMINHRNVLTHCKAISLAGGVSDHSRSLCWLPYFHDYGLLHGIIAPFYAGIPAYLMSPITVLRRPLLWLEAVSKFSITHSGGPNFSYESCTRAFRQQSGWQADLGTWMIASCGAEPIQAATVDRFIETFEPLGFRRTSFAPAYGLAEATLLVTMKQTGAETTFVTVEAEALADSTVKTTDFSVRGTRTLVGCGRPIAETHVLIVNPTTQRTCQDGVVGEVWVAGDGIAIGYWRRPEESEATFDAICAGSGGGPYLRTGDLGFIHQGELFLTGRLKDLIIVRGRNYYPHDLEWTVEQSHPGLRRGCGAAFSIESETGERVVLVYETEKKLAESDRPEVMSSIRRALADEYELEVHNVVLVKSGTIPRTSSGKIQRHACKANFESGQLVVVETSMLGVPEVAGDIVPLNETPRSPVEEGLASIWQEVLGSSQPRRDANFFTLGGNSLLATQVVSRIQDTFSVDFPLRTIFDSPTIAQLAEHILVEQRRGTGRAPLPKIVPVPRTEPLPLSYSQQRMWVLYRLVPEGTAYNMSFASRQTGPLKTQWLRQTIELVTRRHDSFRTTFRMTENGPVQIVSEWQPPHWAEIDLQALPQHERLAEATRLVEKEARTPFDLERGPVARFYLITLDKEDHIFVLHLHHIIGDQWSFGVIGQEFSAHYNALCQGRSVHDVPLPIQYADFAVWQRRCLTDETLRPQLEYWRERLANLPVLALPTDHPRPPTQTHVGAYCAWDLTSSLTEQIKKFSAHRRVTPFMTLLACFQVLLSRWSGQVDFAVGVPIANRTQVMTEYLVGTFVNTLVLRADLSEDPTFEELVRRVRDTALGAYMNQDYPFEKLVEMVHVNRDPGSSPLIQVLFNVVNAPIGKVDLHELSWVPFEIDTGSAQFDLSLTVDMEMAKKINLSFNTDLFTRQTAERMLGHFCTLFQQALDHPDFRVSELQMLSPVEEQQLLAEWNNTEVDYPHALCFPQLFEAQVVLTPEAIAVSMDGRTLTYRALNAQANQMARVLSATCATPHAVVGIYLERSLEKLVALLAVWKTGGSYLPLDPSFPRDRIRFMVEDAEVSLVMTTTALSDHWDLQSCPMLCLDLVRESIVQEADENIPALADPHGLAYLMYTSGSTGRSKGVEITHRSLVNFLWSMRREPGCSSKDIVLSVTTLSFDIAGLELFLPLLVGGRVEIVSSAVAMDGHKLRKCYEAVQPTLMQATPATWHLLLDAGWTGSPSLTALCGGEALSTELAAKLLERTKALWNMYGPTETTIWSTVEKVRRGEREITIGRPIANTEIYILDHHLKPVPVGVSGELFIGGHGVARGYRRRPDLTEERFLADPFSSAPHARLYRTGDVARYRSDGRIVHLGRLDNQVKIRGFRIELGEIESVLSRHPAVRQVVVRAQDDQKGLKQLVAYLVCQEEPSPAPADLREFVRSSLPDYMTPSYFLFLEALPLTANNKVDMKALPPPVIGVASQEREYVGPRNRMEVQLTALWEQALEISKVGIHDNFFDIGGHSLKAAQLFFLLEQVYGRHLPLATLFQAPTIADLAAVLSREQWVPPWQSLVAIQPCGTAIPIFMVPGVGGNVLVFARLARLLGRDQPVYGLQARGLDGENVPLMSVTEMAKHYIAEIRTIRPQGPYVIVGACTGGLIAYEMAQQFHGQGEAVKLVVMDTWHPTSYHQHAYTWPMRIWLPVFMLLRAMKNIHVLLRLPLKDWTPYIHRKTERVMSFIQHSDTQDDLYNEFQIERVTQSTRQAVARYSVLKYPGNILNIVASKRNVDATIVDTRFVWTDLSAEGSRTVCVPAADSGLLLTSLHAEEVSDHLQAFLAESAQDESAYDLSSRDVHT